MLVIPAPDGETVRTVAFRDHLDAVHPSFVIEALCMQERAFGSAGLRPPDEL
jgi:hypothetical protein